MKQATEQEIKQMLQTLKENEDELREAYLDAVRDQYRVPTWDGRIIRLYLNLDTGNTFTGTYASTNNYTRFEDDVIHVSTIRGWDVSDRWSDENPSGETKTGYLYNPHYDFNDGWEPENRVVDTVIEEKYGKDFDDYILSRIKEQMTNVAKERTAQKERNKRHAEAIQ